jgi:hypothetical protein
VIKRYLQCVLLFALLLTSSRATAQEGSSQFDKVWIQGEALVYSTSFSGTNSPANQILSMTPLYLRGGNANICDSAGNLMMVSDGYNLYNKNLTLIDGGQSLASSRIIAFNSGWSLYSQTSIILPFGNGKYRLVTPSASDDSCYYNWEQVHNGAYFDLILYHEVDMNANGGAGKVIKRSVPILQNARLSKTQMMACRHGDGKSWWLLKQAADTNLVYKFLFTEDKVYGPFVQGFTGAASRFGGADIDGQSMFSADGTKYASTQFGFSGVFVADFDRCTGMLSNPKVYKVPAQLVSIPSGPTFLDSTSGGLAFSPNGRYLYVSGACNIHQLDLNSTPSSPVWTYLYGLDTSWYRFQEYSNIYPGHDGKLYIGNWGGIGGQMSVINSPDSSGAAADFCRKCLRFPGYYFDTTFVFAGVSTPPCMPNYALGPTSPICYPTGIQYPKPSLSDFRLYPIPSKGMIEVRSTDIGQLTIVDMIGREIASFPINSKNEFINLTHLLDGVYQYEFRAKNGNSKSGPLVISKG